MHSQVVSRQRVVDHGEVYTHPREVNAMLDLVSHECDRIESRFLEPACGTGNFLVEVLRRKLAAVERRYASSQLEFERYGVLAVCSIYGIDLLADNVQACQDRLWGIFADTYLRIFKEDAKPECLDSVRHILTINILHGDALTLKTVASRPKPIVFAEWSPVNGSFIKRRDFVFEDLVIKSQDRELPLFSDHGEEAFIPNPSQEYPLIHFLKLGQVA
jgi:hypothetical protein